LANEKCLDSFLIFFIKTRLSVLRAKTLIKNETLRKKNELAKEMLIKSKRKNYFLKEWSESGIFL